MSSAEVIDALFLRTVDIVQSLPKSGPIQTSYEEKLALYSLYKQATEGDVRTKRPGMLDMLGRAKFDAWANRRGLSRQDAKQLYVESMLKTLRKFSDRPQAMALIEEMESFSGDVAQRVMSASLARADSDSEGSSEEGMSPHITQQRLAVDEEDERDAVAQLPRTSYPGQRFAGSTSASVAAGLRSGQRTPLSVEGASAMAVRGAGRAEGSSIGGSEVDEEEEETGGGGGRRPATSSRFAPAAQRSGGAVGMRGGAQAWHQRPSGSLPSGEGRLYAVPGQRYPGPPASDAPGGGLQGGAGASLYSAVGPSQRPTPSEQHFYHHHGGGGGGGGGEQSSRAYAPPSSVGGRSGGGGGPSRGGVYGGSAGRSADVDMALQSIQASLAALHERMNRVEGRGGRGGVGRPRGWSNSALGTAYLALSDALHDIAVLLGVRSDGRGGVAPSTYRGDGGESATSRGRKPNGISSAPGAGGRRAGWSAVFRLLLALAQIAIRLALDATSVAVVLTVLLFLLKRTTGRGDPLLILRLIRRWSGVRVPAIPKKAIEGTQ